MPQLRINHSSYKSDISKLRDIVRSNGTLQNIVPINVSHVLSNFVMHVNLCYQSNGAVGNIAASLYTLAFQNNNGIWRFNDAAGAGIANAVLFNGNPSGSYASLGCAMAIPQMTQGNIGGACAAIANFNGGQLTAGFMVNLAHILVVGSEAIRSSKIDSDVYQCLKGTAIIPDWHTLHNWGGHTLG